MKNKDLKSMTPLTCKVNDILAKRAAACDVITFGALAEMVGIPPINLKPMLDRIHKEDLAAKPRRRPSRASIVISAKDLRMPSAWSGAWTRKEWNKERLRAHHYYRKAAKKNGQ